MRSVTYFVPIILLSFILQSCATYKPNYFDYETRHFKNYKDNYSIEILDGYNLVSSDGTKNLASFYGFTPRDSVLFFNKEKEISFMMYFFGKFNLNKPFMDTILLNSIAEGVKKKEQQSIQEGTQEQFTIISKRISHSSVIFEVGRSHEFGNEKSIVKYTLFPLTKGSYQHGGLMLAVSSRVNNFDIAKKDFFKMIDSLNLTAFDSEERSRN